jgi:CheY-like chemotaxis protein
LFAACEQRLPDIVLLDMKMGEFKGDKVLEQLLAAYPGCASSSSPAIRRSKTCAPLSR